MSGPDPTPLQSTANPTVRRLARLRDNRTRRRQQRVLVDGWRETARAIESGMELLGLYTCDSDTGDKNTPVNDATQQHATSTARSKGCWQPVSNTVMQKISYGQSNRGVVAEFQQPNWSLDRLRLPENPLILILDAIEKPGNVGAVFRCADAAGIDAVVLSDCECDLFNPNAIRSSLGTIFTVPAASGSAEQVHAFLAQNKIRPLAARVESSTELWSTDMQGSLAIILGSESDGLGDRWQTLEEQPIVGVRIPMNGKVDSLNVSVSAALLAFEALRARRPVSR